MKPLDMTSPRVWDGCWWSRTRPCLYLATHMSASLVASGVAVLTASAGSAACSLMLLLIVFASASAMRAITARASFDETGAPWGCRRNSERKSSPWFHSLSLPALAGYFLQVLEATLGFLFGPQARLFVVSGWVWALFGHFGGFCSGNLDNNFV